MKTKRGEIKVKKEGIEIEGEDFEFFIPLGTTGLLKFWDILEEKKNSFRIGKVREGKKYLLETFVPENGVVVVVGKIFEGEEVKKKLSFRLRQGKYVLIAEVKEALKDALKEGWEIKRFVFPLYYSLSDRGLYMIWKEEEAYIPKKFLIVLREALKSDGNFQVGKVKVESGKLFIGNREVDKEHKREIERLLELI